jgi:hypothetical protein
MNEIRKDTRCLLAAKGSRLHDVATAMTRFAADLSPDRQIKRPDWSPLAWLALGHVVFLGILFIGIMGCSDGDSSGVRAGSGRMDIPAWVVRYPGAEVRNAKSLRVDRQKMGAFAQETSDTVEQVAGYFESELKEAGFQVWNNEIFDGDAEERLVIATVETPHRHMKVTVKASASGSELEAEYGSDDPQ